MNRPWQLSTESNYTIMLDTIEYDEYLCHQEDVVARERIISRIRHLFRHDYARIIDVVSDTTCGEYEAAKRIIANDLDLPVEEIERILEVTND